MVLFYATSIFEDLILRLKEHCHGDFAVFWSKRVKYFTEALSFSNINLLLEHYGGNERNTNYDKFLVISQKYTGRT